MVSKRKDESDEEFKERRKIANSKDYSRKTTKARKHNEYLNRKEKQGSENQTMTDDIPITPILSYPPTPGCEKASSKSRAPPGTSYKDMSRAQLDAHAYDCTVDMIESSKRDSEILQANARALTADLKQQSLVRYQSHQQRMAMLKRQQDDLDQQAQIVQGEREVDSVMHSSSLSIYLSRFILLLLLLSQAESCSNPLVPRSTPRTFFPLWFVILMTILSSRPPRKISRWKS